MRNERPDPIDEVIDEAARRLVAGEPSSALRSSVRDRIAKRRSVWSFVPALAGAAALLVVAVIVGRALLGPVDAPEQKPTVARSGAERPGDAVASQPTNVTPIQPVPSAPRQLARRLAADITALPPEEESPIPPIAIEPLTTAQIAVDVSSGVMPIEIAPLQIEPLLGQ